MSESSPIGAGRATPAGLYSGLRRTRGIVAPALVAALIVGAIGLQKLIVRQLEREAIELRPLGPETPSDFGATFETVVLPVNGRLLQARIVRSTDPSAPALLIFHGNGEAVSDWSRVQAQLQTAGISSMVFDYSGFGSSTGTPSVAHFREDALIAYRLFAEQFPATGERCLLGHSLGNAVMLDVLESLRPVPACVVVHAGFTSAREMAVHDGLVSPWLARLLPDIWDCELEVARGGPATLVIHGEQDEVVPVEMGIRLAQAAGPRAKLLLLPGIKHDMLYQDPRPDEWQPIITFVRHGPHAEQGTVDPTGKIP